MVGYDWCISILIVPARSCSLSGPLLYHSPVVFLDRRHVRFRNFNSAVPVDVIRVKSYVDIFLDPTTVPVRVSINKLYPIPKRIMAENQNRRVVQQRTVEGATSRWNSEDRNAPITADHRDINGAALL